MWISVRQDIGDQSERRVCVVLSKENFRPDTDPYCNRETHCILTTPQPTASTRRRYLIIFEFSENSLTQLSTDIRVRLGNGVKLKQNRWEETFKVTPVKTYLNKRIKSGGERLGIFRQIQCTAHLQLVSSRRGSVPDIWDIFATVRR